MQLRSIRGRLILLAAAVVLPSLLLAGLLVAEAHRNERVVVERQLFETARALSLVVDRQLGQAEVLLKALAATPALAQGDLPAFRRQAAAALQNDDSWVVLAHLDGTQLVNTAVAPGAPLPTSTVPEALRASLRQGRTYVSDLLPSTANRGYALRVAVPVRSGGDTLMLALGTTPAALSDILADQQLPEDWIAAIIDRQGIIVARSRLNEQFVGSEATPDIRQLVRTTTSGIVESVTLDGVPTLAAYNRSPAFGWTVIIGAPTAELYAGVRHLLVVATLVALLLVLLGFGMYVWVARGIVRAVDTLARGADAVGQGAVPTHLTTGIDETDGVAAALLEAGRRLRAREAELLRLNETLEARVQARTDDYAAANRALSIRNRELQDFAYVASHDLQEPLRKIQAFAGLLESEYGEQVGETGHHYLARMRAAADRMSRLIHDLLAFSRVTTQTQPAVPVDLNRTLSAVLSDLEMRLEEVQGCIDVGPLHTVHADPVQMHQLLLNLIGNALKFHRPDVPPVVRVATEKVDHGVRIVVEDNGIGFDEQYAERIFAPFQRLHGRDAYEGTGMGLAIVRRIAERHGGSAVARGTPGEGSRFEVTLPLETSQQAPAEDATPDA